jgi:hypothetical protein
MPWSAAVYNYNIRNRAKYDPEGYCMPPGGPRLFTAPYPMEIIQQPEQQRVLFLFEGATHIWREVYLDGRPHPAANAIKGETWLGHSVGHYEDNGKTLVVDVAGFNEGTWLDFAGHPHTNMLHIVEKFSRPTRDSLRYQVTIDDSAPTPDHGRPHGKRDGGRVPNSTSTSVRKTTNTCRRSKTISASRSSGRTDRVKLKWRRGSQSLRGAVSLVTDYQGWLASLAHPWLNSCHASGVECRVIPQCDVLPFPVNRSKNKTTKSAPTAIRPYSPTTHKYRCGKGGRDIIAATIIRRNPAPGSPRMV